MEYGAILPNNQPSPLETYQGLQNQEYNRSLQMYQMQQQKDMRDMEVAKYIASQMDPESHGSGTEIDPILNSTLSDAQKRLSQRLANGDPYASIVMDAANTSNQVAAYANKAKQIKSDILAQATPYAKIPGVDTNMAVRLSLANAFHGQDGHVKPLDQIDPAQDYFSQTLQKYPRAIVTGTGMLDPAIKSAPMTPYDKEFGDTRNGVQYDMAYKGKYSPLFHDLVDSKGNLVGANGNATGTKVKGETIQVGNDQVQGVPQAVLDHFDTDRGVNLLLNADVQRLKMMHPEANDEDLRRIALYNHLNADNNGYINNTKNKVNDMAVYRAQQTRDNILLRDTLKSRNEADDAKVKDNPLLGVIAGMSGNPNYRSPEPVDWEGKKVYDFTPFVHGASVYSGKNVMKPDGTASKEAFAGIGQNADTGNLIVRKVDTKNKKTGELSYANTEIEPKDEFDWFKKVGEANGMSAPKIAEIYNQSLGKTVNERQAKYEQDHGFYNKHQTGPIFGQDDQLPEQAAPVQQPFHKRIINSILNAVMPTYSKQALKDGGWTDEQIDKAVNAGKIKVN